MTNILKNGIICFVILLILNNNMCFAEGSPETLNPTVEQFPLKINLDQIGPDYKGNLNFSYPLLTVPGRNNLNYDIILNYVAGGGVSAFSNASWVGLGWNLNLGQISCLPAKESPWTYLGSDRYLLSFPGGTYMFVNKSIIDYPVGDPIWCLDKNDGLLIEELEADSQDRYNYTGFIVTTVDGTRYVFNHALKRNSNSLLLNHSTQTDPISGEDIVNDKYIYVIKLTAILAPNYIDGSTVPDFIPDNSTNADMGDWIKFEYTTPFMQGYPNPSYSGYGINVYESDLKKIITPTHKAVFYMTYGETCIFTEWDRSLYDTGKYLKELTSIKLYNYKDVQGNEISEVDANVLKEVCFNQIQDFYFYNNDDDFKRHRLSQIDFYGSGGYNGNLLINSISFNYHNYPYTEGDAKEFDKWGMFTENMTTDPDPAHCDRWMLKDVILPTGGKISFEYESDYYIQLPYERFDQPANIPEIQLTGGGVRLTQKTIYKDADDNLGQEYHYSYAKSEYHTGYGFISGYPPLSAYQGAFTRPFFSAIGDNYIDFVHYPDITITLPNGSKIIRYYTTAATGYNDVVEYEPDEKYPPTCTIIANTSLPWYASSDEIYDDNIRLNYGWHLGFVFYREFTNHWKRGIMWKEEKYGVDDSEYYISEKSEYYYTFIPNHLKVLNEKLGPAPYDPSAADRSIFFTGGWVRLDKIQAFNYGDNNEDYATIKTNLFKYKNFSDNVNYLPEMIIDEGSQIVVNEESSVKNRVIRIKYAYEDYSDMENHHMISQKTQETIYQFNGYADNLEIADLTSTDARSSTKITWKDNWDHGTGKEQWAEESVFTWISNSSSPSLPDWVYNYSYDQWRQQSKTLSRDIYGRVTQVEDDNVDLNNNKYNRVKFFYGYYTDYDTNNIDPFETSFSGPYLTAKQKIMNTLDAVPASPGVRNGDDLITEYQYNELGQITKIIDENGIDNKYEYNNKWQLAFIKNYNNELLNTYEYHLKGEGTTGYFFQSDPNAILEMNHFSDSKTGYSINYFDGLSRSIQTQTKGINSEHFFVGTVYNNMGQNAVTTKPMRTDSPSIIGYKIDLVEEPWTLGTAMTSSSVVNNYYDASPLETGVPNCYGYPYVFTEYNSDPSGRVSRIYYPGLNENSQRVYTIFDYSTCTSNQTIGNGFTINSVNTDVEYDVESYDDNGISVYEAPLSTSTVINGNNRTTEYKDDWGNLVRKTTEMSGTDLITDYHYDILNNLVRVFSPMSKKSENQGTNNYITEYDYNTAGQLLEKRTPDAGTIKYKYDDNNNLRFVQDANHASYDYMYYTFDEMNRVIYIGERTGLSSTNSEKWESILANTSYLFESNESNLWVVNYYDSEPGYGSDVWTDAEDPGNLEYLKGRLAATAYKDKDSGNWGYTFYSYTPEGFVDKVIQDLPDDILEEQKVISYEYDRLGNLIKTSYQQGVDKEAFYQWREYDIAGNLEKIKANNVDDETTAKNWEYQYWPTGQVKSLKYPGMSDDVKYTYTGRDWINKIYLNTIFQEDMVYNDLGNITQMTGKVDRDLDSAISDELDLGFDFTYDLANRLTSALKTPRNIDYTDDLRDVYLHYDLNGNITFLTRTPTESYTPSANDVNYYYYNSNNRLDRYQDSDAVIYTDYTYDNNGNLTSDLTKNLAGQVLITDTSGKRYRYLPSILYNYQNLPYYIGMDGTNLIKYGYNTLGKRIYKNVQVEIPAE